MNVLSGEFILGVVDYLFGCCDCFAILIFMVFFVRCRIPPVLTRITASDIIVDSRESHLKDAKAYIFLLCWI